MGEFIDDPTHAAVASQNNGNDNGIAKKNGVSRLFTKSKSPNTAQLSP